MVDIVVLGGINTDFAVWGDRLPGPGETVMGYDFEEGPGGKGANQAVAAARLGATVRLVGCVGDDPRGRWLIESMEDEGVDVSSVRVDPTAPTGAAIIAVGGDGRKQIITAPGANLSVGLGDVAAGIHGARVLVVQLEVPDDVVREAVRGAHDAGMRVILDAAPPRHVPDHVLARVDVLRANATEAEALSGVAVRDRATAAEAASWLRDHGANTVIIAAPDGDLVLNSSGETWLPHLHVRSMDDTGAGDAFVGALAAEIAAGVPLGTAVTFANAAAAVKTTRFGAQAGLPTRDEVVAMLEEGSAERMVTAPEPA